MLYLASNPNLKRTPGDFQATITMGDDDLLHIPSYLLDVADKLAGARSETAIQLYSLLNTYPEYFYNTLYWTPVEFSIAMNGLTELLNGHIPARK